VSLRAGFATTTIARGDRGFLCGPPDGSNRTRRAVTVEALLFEFRREFPRSAVSFDPSACPSLPADLTEFAGGKFEVSVLP